MGQSSCCQSSDVNAKGSDGLVSALPAIQQYDEEVVSSPAQASTAKKASPKDGKTPAQLSDLGARMLQQRYPIGRRVIVASRKGRIRHVGACKFAPGLWCGVELDGPFGKNDGTVAKVEYFKCEANHGVFVRPAMVELAEEDEDATAQDATATTQEEDSCAGPASTATATPEKEQVTPEKEQVDEPEEVEEYDVDDNAAGMEGLPLPRDEPRDLEKLKAELKAAGAEAEKSSVIEKDGSFYITLDKGEGPQRRKLGLDATATRNLPYLKVLRVRPEGLIHDWNVAHPEREVKNGMIITEINGVRGDKDKLYDLVGNEQVMIIRIEPAPVKK